MATLERKALVVAGLTVDVYADTNNTASEVSIVFLLHGRTGSAKDVTSIAESLLQQVAVKRMEVSRETPSLVVIAFVSLLQLLIQDDNTDLTYVVQDQRNHGTRLVNPIANSAWTKDEQNNDEHA